MKKIYAPNTLGYYFNSSRFARSGILRSDERAIVLDRILPAILDEKFLREDIPSTSVCGKAIIAIVHATVDYIIAISAANAEASDVRETICFALDDTQRKITCAARQECECIYYG